LLETRGDQHGTASTKSTASTTMGSPRACYRNNIDIVIVFTQTNIIIYNKGKIIDNMGKCFMSEVCIKLAVMCIIQYPRSNSYFKHVGDLFCRQIQ